MRVSFILTDKLQTFETEVYKQTEIKTGIQ